MKPGTQNLTDHPLRHNVLRQLDCELDLSTEDDTPVQYKSRRGAPAKHFEAFER